MFSSMKFGIGTAVIVAAAFGFGGQAYAQSASAHQDFNAQIKKCVDLGKLLGHACTPDIHITGTAYEKVEFTPNPQAKVRLKVTSPFSFDTGFQGIDSSGCEPVGATFYGEGAFYCTTVSDINISDEQIKFNIAQSMKMTIGIPHVKEWSVEVPLWHRAVDVRK